MYAIVTPREPDYDAYTYEEQNVRRAVQLNPHEAPDPVRQSASAEAHAGRKTAEMQAAIFYSHQEDNLSGEGQVNSLGPVMLGSHLLVGKNEAWTQSPRGIMSTWGDDRPVDRDLPDSFGSQIEPIAGGKF